MSVRHHDRNSQRTAASWPVLTRTGVRTTGRAELAVAA